MKLLFPLMLLFILNSAHAKDKWRCRDNSGFTYTVSDRVPSDICEAISKEDTATSNQDRFNTPSKDKWNCKDAAGNVFNLAEKTLIDKCQPITKENTKLVKPKQQITSQVINCDESSSHKVKNLMAVFGKEDSSIGYQKFVWNSKTDNINEKTVLRLMTTFADADACLMQSAREIRFYRNGKLEGVVSDSGARLIK